jgi:dTDP-4-dehydrorhamnose 3,5-epimerase
VAVNFEFDRLTIPGLILIKAKVFPDQRGFFLELYRSSLFRNAGIQFESCQVNHSHSSRGVLRGLHYQLSPQSQAKLVHVVSGEIFDVAVDIRKDSPTFGRWFGIRLVAEQHMALFIPEGFAHGFCVLSSSADVIYFCSKEYSPEQERGIIWNDPTIAIDWPILDPAVSKRDLVWPNLNSAEINL